MPPRLASGGRLSHQAPPHDPDQLDLRHRLGEQIALPDIAADALQLVAFMRRLDALGDGLAPEALAELHDRFAQAGTDPIGMAVRHVAAVDVELAERKLPQAR